MPNREDETWLNTNPHPPACTCHECNLRRLRGERRKIYPYPAEMICPACDEYSMYYSAEITEYICLNSTCGVRAKTLKEISDRKAKITEQLKVFWDSLG